MANFGMTDNNPRNGNRSGGDDSAGCDFEILVDDTGMNVYDVCIFGVAFPVLLENLFDRIHLTGNVGCTRFGLNCQDISLLFHSFHCNFAFGHSLSRHPHH